jgi:hypothetical protein
VLWDDPASYLEQASRRAHSAQAWATSVYGGAALGDRRRTARLVQVAATMASRPQDSLLHALQDWAPAKGAYRLIENDKVTVEALVEASRDAAVEACRGRRLVLAVSDTTSLNFTNLRATQDLGPIGEEQHRGLLLHSTLMMDPEGVPLGVIRQDIWTRKDEEHGKRHQRNQRAFEEKESHRWLLSIQDCGDALDVLPEDERPYVIHVFDREGDIHEVLAASQSCDDGYIIRSCRNRRVKAEDPLRAHLREAVAAAPVLGRETVPVPRKQGERKREARVTYRACEVTLDPRQRPYRQLGPVTLNAVWVTEESPPSKGSPLDWLLLTTEPIDSLRDVKWIVQLYKFRWRIEELHLILKSGCRMEKVQFETSERIAKVLALYVAVSLRILRVNYLARNQPELPCTAVLSEDEWQALWTHIKGKPPSRGQPPPTIKQAVMWIGRLGGHPGRKSDGMPGVRTLWLGWRDLEIMTTIYVAMKPTE